MDPLEKKYLDEIKPKLKEEFNIKNAMATPKLIKIVINMGIADAKDDAGILEKAQENLTLLSGQKPITTKAKKSIANFKLTKGTPIGLMVTLRENRMYAFLNRLINIVLPKVRDFKGIDENSFDVHGNFNLGLRELSLFPEIEYKNTDKTRGLQITINTTAKTKQEGKRLLELFEIPFRGE